MKKEIQYRHQAKECRRLAKQMALGDHRDQLLKIAETWDKLADEREARSSDFLDHLSEPSASDSCDSRMSP